MLFHGVYVGMDVCSFTDGHLGGVCILALMRNQHRNAGISLGFCFHFFWVYTQKWNAGSN